MPTENSTIPKKRKQAEKRVFVTCKNCGKKFSIPPCRLLRGDGKFCDEICRYFYVIPVPSPEKYFWEKAKKTDSCWIWTAATSGGYGKFSTGRRKKQTQYGAHRFAWILKNGPIPNDLCVLHHCDNRLCVNPAHLFLGTRRDNADDMLAKGRSARGEKHSHAIFSDTEVRQIKEAIRDRPGTLADVARQFGILYVTIQAIYHGRNWKHIQLSY